MTNTNTKAGTLLLSYRPAPYCPATDKTSRRYACETNLTSPVPIRLRHRLRTGTLLPLWLNPRSHRTAGCWHRTAVLPKPALLLPYVPISTVLRIRTSTLRWHRTATRTDKPRAVTPTNPNRQASCRYAYEPTSLAPIRLRPEHG